MSIIIVKPENRIIKVQLGPPGPKGNDGNQGDEGTGAPLNANYLVGTANSSLTNEIPVGTSPGGELGGTWASPTIDTVHSGSSHAQAAATGQAAAEATAAAALLAHEVDATDAHAGSAITNTPAGNLAATTVQGALNELDTEKAATSHVHSGADITTGTVLDARIDSAIARDTEVTAAIAALSSIYAALVHVHAGEDITSGTVADARIAATIARDSEVTAAVAAEATARDAAIASAVAGLINSAPGALDTLNELAAALGNDANFAATMTAALALKAPLASPTFTGVPAAPTASGGTNTTQLATTAFVAAAIVALSSVYQAKDTDLDIYAGITPSSNVQSILGAANYAAIRTLLGLVIGTNVQAWDADLDTLAGLTATTDNFIVAVAGAWASRTPAQAKTSLALVKGDVGLGSVDNTADSAKVVASAAALTTARNIDGQSFDGTAAITVIAPGTHAATGKTTPVDADEMPLVDSAASNVLKKLTWANLKATLKTYYDTLYQPTDGELTAIAGLTSAANKIPMFSGSGTATLLDRDTDGTLAANSDTSIATQKAVKTYVTANAGASFFAPSAKIGDYMRAPGLQQSSVAPVTGGLYLTRIFIPAAYTFDRISIYIDVAASSSGTARLGIYNDANGRPTSVVLDASTVSIISGTGSAEITINQALGAGTYWLGALFIYTGGSPAFQGTYLAAPFFPVNALNLSKSSLSLGGQSGTLSANPAAVPSGDSPLVWLRRSA